MVTDVAKRPKHVRRRDWPDGAKAEIRRLRTAHPNLGKGKIHVFLKRFCGAKKPDCPKPRAIGRMIADAPDKMRAFPVKIRHNGIAFTDAYSRFSFAFATASHASQAATDFFKAVRVLFPYCLECILTDNGSEFMKRFDAELKRLCLTHWHTYPKTPKMNAHCERFNRTIQENFVDYRLHCFLTTSTLSIVNSLTITLGTTPNGRTRPLA